MTKSLATSKHIFNITAEQRAALHSPQLCCDDVEFNEILKSIKQTYNTEGFVLIRGLLDDDAKERLVAAGHELQSADTRRPPIGNQFNVNLISNSFHLILN